MKVYVDFEDKEFLDACLSECRVYEYVADELQYSDRLKLVSLTDYTKQVRKEVCEEIRKEFLYVSGTTTILANNGCIGSRTLEKFLDKIQGEGNERNIV